MTQEAVLKTLAGASAAAGVGSGTFGAVMNYLDEHAGGMGVLCSLISILLFIIFKLWEISKTKQESRAVEDIEKLNDVMVRIESSISNIAKGNKND